MFIRIERASSSPVSRQIAEQIRAHCLTGTAQPGDRLPSVRELAHELAVNQNTVLRVYDRLAAEGLLERRQGEGTFVARRTSGRRQHATELRRHRDELERLARQGLMLGLGRAELEALFHQALDRAVASLAAPAADKPQRKKEPRP